MLRDTLPLGSCPDSSRHLQNLPPWQQQHWQQHRLRHMPPWHIPAVARAGHLQPLHHGRQSYVRLHRAVYGAGAGQHDRQDGSCEWQSLMQPHMVSRPSAGHADDHCVNNIITLSDLLTMCHDQGLSCCLLLPLLCHSAAHLVKHPPTVPTAQPVPTYLALGSTRMGHACCVGRAPTQATT